MHSKLIILNPSYYTVYRYRPRYRPVGFIPLPFPYLAIRLLYLTSSTHARLHVEQDQGGKVSPH